MDIGIRNKIESVVENCTFIGYEFTVTEDSRGGVYLQGRYHEADTVTAVIEPQLTRRWFLSPAMTTGEIVQTVFKCVITSMEHRTREWFRYCDEPVFGPHLDIEALLEICRKNRFAHRAT